MAGLALQARLYLSVLIGLATYYHALAPYFRTEKQRAYIMSALSSATMSVISIPFAYTYLRYGLEKAYSDSQSGWMGDLARFGAIFFGVYLFSKFPQEVILFACIVGR